MASDLKRRLFFLTCAERTQLLLLLAEEHPQYVRNALTSLRLGLRRKQPITILDWHITGLPPEESAGSPDRPAALG